MLHLKLNIVQIHHCWFIAVCYEENFLQSAKVVMDKGKGLCCLHLALRNRYIKGLSRQGM